MKYLASILDFFKSPKWGMNLLLGAVTALIPVVGPMVLSGWQITVFWSRQTGEDPARFPHFDFQHFSKYLQRGLWPFLVSLVASIALVPVIMGLTVPVISYVWHHLQKQIYQLYLNRGGEPVPVSPKLSDAPPAVPAA